MITDKIAQAIKNRPKKAKAKNHNKASAQLTGAQILIECLVKQGVDTIFGYPGGSILKIYDALHQHPEITHVLTKHEQAAVHAAEGYARSTGKIGVVFATSGPGATNIVTGIGDAMADATPIVCITGQVASAKIGTDAFQEGDIISITRPITKHSYLIKNASEIEDAVENSFNIASQGRPGPVLIDIPSDIQMQEAAYHDHKVIPYTSQKRAHYSYDSQDIETAITMMKQAKKPIFYCGGGVVNSGDKACQNLRNLVKATGFPITLSLMGLGAFPASEKQHLGMLGMYGTYESNLAMHGADLIIAIGARFDDRITGDISRFAPDAKIIHMDIDSYNIGKVVTPSLAILSDAKEGLAAMLATWKKDTQQQQDLSNWWQQIEAWRAEDCLAFDQEEDHTIKPQTVIHALNNYCKDKDVFITTDVGLHQMWVAQQFDFDQPKRLITSGGFGTMGYGLPAAIGAKIAHPEHDVICISGDGSILMNIQELVTLHDYGISVKIIILNNSTLGMVRQWQDMFYEQRRAETEFPNRVNLPAVAQAFGIRGRHVDQLQDLDEAIAEMMESNRSYLLDVSVCRSEDIFPFIPPGKAHNEIILRKDVHSHDK